VGPRDRRARCAASFDLQGDCRAEIDVDPDKPNGELVIEPDGGIGLVLGSMHYFPGQGSCPTAVRSRPQPFGNDCPVAQGSARMASNPRIDIIAHPGAVIANALPREAFAPDVLETFVEAAELSARHGIAWKSNRLISAKLRPEQRTEILENPANCARRPA